MRATVRTFALAVSLSGVVATGLACVPDKSQPADFLKAPKSWQPKSDAMTLSTTSLERFNGMSISEQEAFVEGLKAQVGGFRGQARFQRVVQLGPQTADAQLGAYEAYATVDEPVLYEITIDYRLFSSEHIGRGLPTGTYVSFSGTVVDLAFHNEAKPRKLELKVKDVTLERLED